MGYWVLILFIYAGPFAEGDNVAMIATPMSSEAACRAAGDAAVGMSSGTMKSAKYICAKT